MARRLRATDQRPRTHVPTQPVVVVDPRVARRALELAQGDPTRIRVISATAVLVVNRGRN